MTEATQRISLNPETPVQGQQVTVTYNFSGIELQETRLRITFGPNGTPTDYTVTRGDPGVSITVPSDATSILIEDLDGPSPDMSAAVAPASQPCIP